MSITTNPVSERWKQRRVSSALLRIAIFLVPLAVGFAAGSFVGRSLPAPTRGWEVAGWWLLVVVTASIAATLTDRFSRRLLPMAVLLKMTMVFPDHAPSRLKVARKAGNISQLRRRASGADGDTTLAESAEVILSLAAALSQHDRKTRGHSERTRAYTDMLAEEMGLSSDDRDRLRWAALLHDVGKLEVPAEILNKDGPLTPEDWKEIHHHPVYGMKLIAPLIPWLGSWAQTVEHHHEQWDGSGYPYGLSGKEIALGARIVAVADAYDVMTSGRSYQPAKTPAVTRKEIASLAGKQFDPDVVRALMNVSLGRLRWATGPIAFLAEMPFIRGIPQFGRDAAVLLTSSAVVVTAATGAAPLPFDFEAPRLTPTTIVEDFDPTVAAGRSVTTSSTTPGLPPVVIADLASTEEDTPISIDVLANDTDPDSDLQPGTLGVTAIPRIGTAVASGGFILYTPGEDLFGEDRFSYRVCDAGGRCASTTVDVTVHGVNDPPLAAPITATTPQATLLTVALAFSDPEADPITCRLKTPPSVGAATVPADCSRFTFNPPSGFSGAVTMVIEVSDGTNAVPVPVDIEVTPTSPTTTTPTTTPPPPPPPPGFNPTDDFVEVVSEKNLVFDPTINDSAGDKKTVTIISGPSSGTATVIASGNIRYVSNAGFTGADKLVYQVCTPDGTCGTATVTINVK